MHEGNNAKIAWMRERFVASATWDAKGNLLSAVLSPVATPSEPHTDTTPQQTESLREQMHQRAQRLRFRAAGGIRTPALPDEEA